MKKIITGLLIGFLALPVMAQHWHRGHHHHHRGPTVVYRDNNWVIPALISGAVVYAATRPTVVEQPPVVVQQSPIIVQRQPVCTEWREIQHSDGTIYKERICTQ